MKPQKKCRFINLAAQLAEQNEIVSSTMDSLLDKVAEQNDLESRSDYQEIQKTSDNINVPRPKHTATNSQAKDSISQP